MRAVAALPATGLVAGCAIGLFAFDVPSPLGFALLVGSAAAAVWAWRSSNLLALAAAVWTGFFVGGVMLAGNAWREASRSPLRIAFEEIVRHRRQNAGAEGRRLPEDDEALAVVEGTLRADAGATASGVALGLDVDSIHDASVERVLGADSSSNQRAGLSNAVVVSGGLQVTVVGELAREHLDDWRAGRRARMPVQLRRPSRYLDPGVPDFERALARRGVALVGTVKSGALVEVLARGGPVDEVMARVRAFARRAISSGVGSWSQRSQAIVAAIVIGDRVGLDQDVQRTLQDAGTYHVIAISGGNVAILAGVMLAAFRLGGMLGPVAMVSAIFALIAYARLVGGGASVDRATLMAVVYFAGRGIDLRAPPLNTLAFVTACLLASGPLAVGDPAFVLTFSATLAILLIIPLVREWQLPRFAVPLVGLFAASIATEIMLLPVGALVFSRVTFAGLALNFAAVPLMAVAQIAGMLLVPSALVSSRVTSALGFIAHCAAAGLVSTAELVRFVPAVSFRVAPPSWPVVGLYYFGLASVGLCRSRKVYRAAAAAATVVAGAWIIAEPWAFVVQRGDDRLHVTFIDVGQGDSALVRLPKGTTLLVDAGGLASRATFDIGDRIVAPVLRAAGVRRLDFMALTHGDPDHIGGAMSVTREFRPRNVWEGVPVPSFEPLQNLRREAQAVGARWSSLKTGDRAELDGVDVVVHHPDAPDWERQRVRNDDSMVIELRWRDISVLLTGDIGKAPEGALLSAVFRAPVRIVKVPHHGSPTSSTREFIRAIAPRIAVVSVGRTNHFGHPAPEVLQRYRDAGAEIFRTDQDGAITLDTDGTSVAVHTFTGRSVSYEPRRFAR